MGLRILWTLVIVLSAMVTFTAGQEGVALMFMGQTLANGSDVCLSDIGEVFPPEGNETVIGDSLACVTNNSACCFVSGSNMGEWSINGDQVPGRTADPNAEIYRNRGDGILRLNVRGSLTTVGDACCMLPDTSGDMQTMCVRLETIDSVCLPSTTQITPMQPTTEAMTTPVTNPNGSTMPNNSTVPPFPIGAIVGAIFGVLVVVALVVVLAIVLYCVLSKRKKKTTYSEVNQLQNVVMETKQADVSGVYYSTVKDQEGTDGAVYEEIDKKKNGVSNQYKTNDAVYTELDEAVPSAGRSYAVLEEKDTDKGGFNGALYEDIDRSHKAKKSPSPRAQSEPRDPLPAEELADMYAVPEKKPKYVNQPASRTTSVGNVTEAEYSEINKDPNPAVPRKSTQLEEYLETKPVDQFTHANGGYSEIEVLNRPKSNTLQPLSRPLNNASMSRNPMYDQTAIRRANTLSATNQTTVVSDIVYAEPGAPTSKAASPEKDTEGIYETIYSEPIQPSLFQATSSLQRGIEEAVLCPYSSIYTLPSSPVPAEEKPLVVSSDNIQEVHKLGTGNFGNVILAKTVGLSLNQLKMSKVDDDRNVKVYVAVKMLKETASKSIKDAFEKEYKFMSRLNHPCVIRLLGICTEGDPFIMMEYMEKGDLNQYLKNFQKVVSGPSSEKTAVSMGTLVKLATQIASGMEYLAQMNFVHRDLATRNCLVGQNNVVKIADFGMSRNLYESHYYIIQGHAILPIRWMSTECFYGKFSAKSDVWAFGVTMWEIFTLAKEEPYHGISDNDVVEDAVKGAARTLLTRPEDCPIDVFRVMEECWVHQPKERATFEDIFALLSSLNFKYSSN